MSTWSKRLRYLFGAALFASMPFVAPLPVAAQGRIGTLPDFTERDAFFLGRFQSRLVGHRWSP